MYIQLQYFSSFSYEKILGLKNLASGIFREETWIFMGLEFHRKIAENRKTAQFGISRF
jgi:hypothetical protein